MGFALTSRAIDKYFSFLTKLDNGSKKKLIVKLTESIEVKENKKFYLRSLFGAWDDSKDSDEIIKESRADKDNSAEF
jgi:hypothetical protein